MSGLLSQRPRLSRYVAGILTLAVFGIAVRPLDRPLQFDAALAAIYALAILSLVVLTGYVGQISLCQATFMGVSAFATGWAVNALGWNYWLAAPMGIAVAFSLGVLVGLPALRLSGILLAIVTVGVALVFDYYFFQDPAFGWFTGGSAGWQVAGASIGHVRFDSAGGILNCFYLLLVLLAIVGVLVVNLHDSGSGRRFRAIRDSEVAAATMGVDLTRYKLLGFGVAAAIAGVAGAFYPLLIGSVSPQPFYVFYSLQFAAFAVLMGIRYVPAAVLGGIFMAFVPELLGPHFLGRWFPGIRLDWFNLALGVLLVVQIILAPTGVWGDMADKIGRLPGAGVRRAASPERAPVRVAAARKVAS